MRAIHGITVREMYKEAKRANEKLLSEYNADFWIPYTTDYQKYDRFFSQMYSSFKYLSEEATREDFTAAVEALLMVNSKKYSELLRVNVVDDELYNILQNYDTTETMERTENNTRSETEGERKDTTNITVGPQENTEKETTESLEGNERTETEGERKDTTNITVGPQENTEKETTESLEGNERTEIEGARQDSTTVKHGQQASDTVVSNPDITSTQEKSVMAFDSDIYNNAEKITTKTDTHAIDTHVAIDEYSDENSTSKGEQNNSITDKSTHNSNISRTENTGERSDTHDFTKGEQTNDITDNGTENYTLTRKGNIGVQTQSEMLQKHLDLWNGFQFYSLIFQDIVNALLVVDYDLCDC